MKVISSKKMGKSNLGWLNSIFHFSFAEYYNPENINFGKLRVINDDLVDSGTGFGTHSHQNMEIISYVVDGELTHADSMGNKRALKRGHAQYMSAGTGVRHSEYNLGENTLRFLQIWILPDKDGHTPNYGDYMFEWNERVDNWLHMVSPKDGGAPIRINQDANIYVTEIEAGKEVEFSVGEGRQVYLVQVEGNSEINGQEVSAKDGVESIEEDLKIKAKDKSHLLVIEMRKED
ncbi:pirin family protein [Peptostreptococcus faecalis]|uniref:pirin family protein n=1 Tax=Peptostreptococcus faecalis TaxID=2045015 RepID=UPI000C7E84AC|nr:pirin family protein [Peptostreptococcus faecalis]